MILLHMVSFSPVSAAPRQGFSVDVPKLRVSVITLQVIFPAGFIGAGGLAGHWVCKHDPNPMKIPVAAGRPPATEIERQTG
jgi:hypothetical protein